MDSWLNGDIGLILRLSQFTRQVYELQDVQNVPKGENGVISSLSRHQTNITGIILTNSYKWTDWCDFFLTFVFADGVWAA